MDCRGILFHFSGAVFYNKTVSSAPNFRVRYYPNTFAKHMQTVQCVSRQQKNDEPVWKPESMFFHLSHSIFPNQSTVWHCPSFLNLYVIYEYMSPMALENTGTHHFLMGRYNTPSVVRPFLPQSRRLRDHSVLQTAPAPIVNQVQRNHGILFADYVNNRYFQIRFFLIIPPFYLKPMTRSLFSSGRK